MATIQREHEQRMVLRHISWETYERLLADHLDSSAPRFTYDCGVLEIMSPLPQHERYNRCLASVVEIVAEERDVNFDNLGSTTYRREDLERGFEPDSSFYIQNESRVRGKKTLDFNVDPPPDLVIEIDTTSPSLSKFSLYAAFGVPELWRYDGERLEIHVLEGGSYVESEESRVLPGVTAAAVSSLMEESKELARVKWLRRVRAWVRSLASTGDTPG